MVAFLVRGMSGSYVELVGPAWLPAWREVKRIVTVIKHLALLPRIQALSSDQRRRLMVSLTLWVGQPLDHFLHPGYDASHGIVIELVRRIARRVVMRVAKRRRVGHHDPGVTVLPE